MAVSCWGNALEDHLRSTRQLANRLPRAAWLTCQKLNHTHQNPRKVADMNRPIPVSPRPMDSPIGQREEQYPPPPYPVVTMPIVNLVNTPKRPLKKPVLPCNPVKPCKFSRVQTPLARKHRLFRLFEPASTVFPPRTHSSPPTSGRPRRYTSPPSDTRKSAAKRFGPWHRPDHPQCPC